MKTSKMSVWTRQNLFDPMTIKISMQVTRWQKFKLLFHRNLYSFDTSDEGSALIRYKKMDGVIFVLSVRSTPTKGTLPERGTE